MRCSSIPTKTPSGRSSCAAAGTRPTSSRSTSTAGFPAITADGVADPPRSEHRGARRRGTGEGTGGRGHRAVPLGVPARRRRAGGADRGGAIRRLPAAGGQRGAATGDDPHVRRQRNAAARSTTRASMARGRRSACAAFASAWRSKIFSRPRSAPCCAPPMHGPLRIMFPFVSGVEQMRAARAVVTRAAETLRGRGEQVPSRADRRDDRSAVGGGDGGPACRRSGFLQHRHQRPDSVHPRRGPHRRSRVAVSTSRCIPRSCDCCARCARAGRRHGIRVAVCGEMAADPVLLALLVGLGLREFSMAPSAIPLAKQALRELHASGGGAGRGARAARRTARRSRSN